MYKILCRECNQVYIGETGRDFKARLGEHKSAATHGLEKSSLPARKKQELRKSFEQLFNYLSFGPQTKPLSRGVSSNKGKSYV